VTCILIIGFGSPRPLVLRGHERSVDCGPEVSSPAPKGVSTYRGCPWMMALMGAWDRCLLGKETRRDPNDERHLQARRDTSVPPVASPISAVRVPILLRLAGRRAPGAPVAARACSQQREPESLRASSEERRCCTLASAGRGNRRPPRSLPYSRVPGVRGHAIGDWLPVKPAMLQLLRSDPSGAP
jgi:hypothetical protein